MNISKLTSKIVLGTLVFSMVQGSVSAMTVIDRFQKWINPIEEAQVGWSTWALNGVNSAGSAVWNGVKATPSAVKSAYTNNMPESKVRQAAVIGGGVVAVAGLGYLAKKGWNKFRAGSEQKEAINYIKTLINDHAEWTQERLNATRRNTPNRVRFEGRVLGNGVAKLEGFNIEELTTLVKEFYAATTSEDLKTTAKAVVDFLDKK